MFPNNLNQNQTGYTSCIKIFGVPILPPLISEKRRKELNDDKQRAIEIEKKLKGKRSSIDSGVMTGSYIEHFRTIESQKIDEASLNQISTDLTFKGATQNGVPMSSFEAVDYVVSDTFLKTALEDPEFREFFSSTAEKIFKDNKIENILNLTNGDDCNSFEVKHVLSKESEIQSSEVLSESSSSLKLSESLELGFRVDSLTQVSPLVESEMTLKCSETAIVNGNRFDDKHTEKQPSSPLPTRIRRNSYTLESPSPVLLEHLAKEIASGKNEADKWHTLPDKKEKAKGPGFKTFSGKSQRKHWNKKICNLSSNLRVENNRTKFPLGRSNTFVKPEKKLAESNYSLPGSSRTSPLQFCAFTRSVDCIKSMGANPLYELNKQVKGNFGTSPESINNINVSQIPLKNTPGYAASDSGTFTIKKDSVLQSASVETSPTSLINNHSSSLQSNCSTDTSPPQIEFSDSASQISVTTQSTYVQHNSVCSRSIDKRNEPDNLNHSEDFDDITSMCSSMSISRFLPSHDISRPSTAEGLSEASIRQLKMKHEHELRELLHKQREEEEIYTQLLSTSGSITSRTTTDLSPRDVFETNSEVLFMDKSRDSCSRELFPLQKLSSDGIQSKQRDNYSEREKEAATKLTAYAKGYLTRRLLKTEKVQQLIELIKESLTCAFSLQLEPHLKPNDLELHERLAHQLNAALCELQTIVSAPVAARMAIIAADRERLRRPASRPSSIISAATRKSILRRQQSLNSAEKNPQESRARTKSFSIISSTGSATSGSHLRSDSASSMTTSSSRKPWR